MSAALQFQSLAETRLPAAKPVHLAIGIFDGVHLGHQAVVESAIHSARRSGGVAGVLTFHPHPSRLFRPQSPVKLIMPVALKSWWLRERLGVDFIITEPFTREFAAIPAAGLLGHLRRALPRLAAVYVGDNWKFGAGRGGDVAALVQFGRAENISVFSVPGIKLDGHTISSTRVRSHLAAGEIAAANALLGYEYFARGPVVPGRKLGRTLGFPTLNLAWQPECAPAYGVYLVRAHAAAARSDDTGRPAIANYGVRPTIEGKGEPRLEIHLLDGETDWGEGTELHVEWRHHLRAERKFAGLEELRGQIATDVAAARKWWEEAE